VRSGWIRHRRSPTSPGCISFGGRADGADGGVAKGAGAEPTSERTLLIARTYVTRGHRPASRCWTRKEPDPPVRTLAHASPPASAGRGAETGGMNSEPDPRAERKRDTCLRSGSWAYAGLGGQQPGPHLAERASESTATGMIWINVDPP
jgi:hypothetical protein